MPAEEITEDAFTIGFPLDGSSIQGFTDINNSDIILVPDYSTFVILPDYFDSIVSGEDQHDSYYHTKSARMFANIHNGFGQGQYSRDSRFIAQNAEKFAKRCGFDKTYWAAELEFFVFDKFQQEAPKSRKKSSHTSKIVSKEAPWTSLQNEETVIHLKKGYYRDSPADTDKFSRRGL